MVPVPGRHSDREAVDVFVEDQGPFKGENVPLEIIQAIFTDE
jgi:hypothetical protein